jgi:hypothetical protein
MRNALNRVQEAEQEINVVVEYLLEQLKVIQSQSRRDVVNRRS